MPEFQYNWTSIPRLQPLGPTLYAPPSPVADQALPAPAAPQVPSPAPPLGYHIQRQLLPPLGHDWNKVSQQPQSQLHLTHQAHWPPDGTSMTQNLRQRTKVDYKDLHTAALQFGREQFCKRCSKAGATVKKSVAKVRKLSLAELFPPISGNLPSSSMASSKLAKAKCFWIWIQSWLMQKASTSWNPNFSSKTFLTICGYLYIHSYPDTLQLHTDSIH